MKNQMKNDKNEKLKKKEEMKRRMKNEKIQKNAKSQKISRFWLYTQNPRRFPGFTVVVVTFLVEILDDFHVFVSECVFFQKKSNNPLWVSPIFRGKGDNFHWTPAFMFFISFVSFSHFSCFLNM